MGKDNLFHKRKARANNALKRKKSKRAPYDKVLIVCEGEKTEPNYFNGLINCYKLSTANVEIDGTCGSSPENVFDRAVDLYKKEQFLGDTFDKVYCVFDKDSHSRYDATIANIGAKKPKGVFFATVSVPCFEYWILLHYKYTTRPYHHTSSESVGDMALKDLQTVFPEYKKGHEGVFERLVNQLEFAKQNAINSLAYASTSNTDNPTTHVHELVEYLQNLKN